jgi:hypothetical protein
LCTEGPLPADSVEKVENTGLPKSQPIRDLSECCRSMLCHFRYAAYTLLERKSGRSPAQFPVSAPTAVKKSGFAENGLFQQYRPKTVLGDILVPRINCDK